MNDMGSRVVEISVKSPKKAASFDPRDMSVALKRGLEMLSGMGWKQYLASRFGKRAKVSLKVNCLGVPGIQTRKAVAYGIAGLLVQAGLSESNVTVWDRQNDELVRAGFRLNYSSPGVRCFGTDTYGVGYESELMVNGEVGSLLSRILTRMSDFVISIPVLKDHILCGYTGTMKNFFGAINNPNKYHMNGCTPYILDLFSAPVIKNRVVLSILDGTFVQCNGGPSYNARWREEGRVLYISEDPVSLDQAGYEKLEELRRSKGLLPLREEKRFPQYIFDAAIPPYELGVAGERVETVREVVGL